MKQLYLALLLIVVSLSALNGCKKTEPSVYAADPLTKYFMPLSIGKYVTYRMDSISFYYFGQIDTTSSYLAKDIVEDSVVDSQGRLAWTVVRYLNDTAALGSWEPAMTYVVTPTGSTIEVNEDNFRFVKLKLPIAEGDTWKGNTYLPYWSSDSSDPVPPYADQFNFSDQKNTKLYTWDYTYQNVYKPFLVRGTSYDSSITVLQANDSSGLPIIDTVFASRTYWTETYAKNIGLIYRETLIWEYQPAPPDGSHAGYKIGFGLKLSIVDHN